MLSASVYYCCFNNARHSLRSSSGIFSAVTACSTDQPMLFIKFYMEVSHVLIVPSARLFSITPSLKLHISDRLFPKSASSGC